MGLFSTTEIKLSSFTDKEILEMIDKKEITSSTWLGSRRVQIEKKGSVSYTVFATRLHKILQAEISLQSLDKRALNQERIEYVQSLHSSFIRKVVNLAMQVLFITKIFGYNQSLRDLQSDKDVFSRVTKDAWTRHFPGFEGSKFTVSGVEYYRVSAAMQRLAGKVQNLENRKDGLLTDKNNLNETVKQLQETEKLLKRANEDLEEGIKRLDGENKNLKTEIENLKAAPLQKEKADLQKKNERLQERNTNLERANIALQKENKALQEQNETLQAEKETLQAEKESLQKEFKGLLNMEGLSD